MPSSFVGHDDDGTCSYNGVSFEGALKTRVRGEDVYSDDGRAVEYTRYTFTIRAVATDTDGNTDSFMSNLHDRLSQPQKRFIFKGMGFHDDIDTFANGDVNYGPKPLIREWNPLPNARTCEFVWEVEVCLAECYGSVPQQPSSFVYDAQISIDRKGWTTRTTSGYISNSNNFAGNGFSILTPDIWRPWFQARVPIGFTREQTWTISPDKRRLNFVLTDEEVRSPHAPPKGVVEISGTHRTRWSASKPVRLQNSLDLHIEVSPKENPCFAWLVALGILDQRIAQAQEKNKGFFVEEISISEDIFGYASDIGFRWRTLTCLDELLVD